MIEIKYSLTIEDIVAFAEFHYVNFQTQQRYFCFMRVVNVLGLFLICAFIAGMAQSYTFLIVGTIGAVAYFIEYPDLKKRLVINSVKRTYLKSDNNAVFTAKRLTVESDKITIATENDESSATWESIEKVMENDKYLFIYTTSSAAHIIPKSAIPADMLDDYTTRIKSYYQNAKEHN